MLKCPVCKTACEERLSCPTCGFSEITKEFLNADDAHDWLRDTVVVFRSAYWKTLVDFEIVGTTLRRYIPQSTNLISKIIVPYGITQIGNNAFESINARTIILPNTVSIIGDNAFLNSGLKEITIPSSVTKIGTCAFSGCRSVRIVIPEELKEVGPNVFDSGRPRIFCIAKEQPLSWSADWYSCVWPEEWGVFWGDNWEYNNGKPVLNERGKAQLTNM